MNPTAAAKMIYTRVHDIRTNKISISYYYALKAVFIPVSCDNSVILIQLCSL